MVVKRWVVLTNYRMHETLQVHRRVGFHPTIGPLRQVLPSLVG